MSGLRVNSPQASDLLASPAALLLLTLWWPHCPESQVRAASCMCCGECCCAPSHAGPPRNHTRALARRTCFRPSDPRHGTSLVQRRVPPTYGPPQPAASATLRARPSESLWCLGLPRVCPTPCALWPRRPALGAHRRWRVLPQRSRVNQGMDSWDHRRRCGTPAYYL